MIATAIRRPVAPARFITHDAFDKRPVGLTVLIMALIIGVWPA